LAGKKKSASGGRKRAAAPAPRSRRAAQALPAQEPPKQRGFPVVGIGASAGGLAAFEAFFKGMPPGEDPGMAFVLVQHLAPDHKSLLSELIRRYTRMKVFEVEDGMAVAPGCACIIPPNRDMAFLHGALHLLEPAAPRGQRLPIDYFFRSLAQDQRERAVGIILSGTGADGTQGARSIKAEGGLVIAQDPKSTEFDGMPGSVIGAGLADLVLPPSAMAAQLIGYKQRAFVRSPRARSAPPQPQGNDLQKILILLRAHSGHDFSQYKPGTTHRRIERRMAIQQIETLEAYVKFAQRTPAEVEALFRDLLIGVTSFFRDPQAFAALEKQVIPLLLAGKAPGATVRVWSAGCSTGEEAYSLAKEELQSVNEEMATVNHELQAKVAELSQVNNDMINLMAGTGIGTVFVDSRLNVQRFTPAATQLINFIPGDVGRPVGHVVSNMVGYHRLVEDLQEVLQTLQPKEFEVQIKGGEWFLLRLRPYRTREGQVEGAVVTFTDITEMKRLRRALDEGKPAPAPGAPHA
jgi:PAS domain-containing protein